MDFSSLEEVEERLQRAIQDRPDDALPYALLGRLYLTQERLPEAREAVSEALQRGPTHPEALFVFGLLSARLGMPEGISAAIGILENSGEHDYEVQVLRAEREAISGRQGEIPADPVSKLNVPPARTWAEDEITFICGTTPHRWSPLSLARGIGGSEEAVIHLAGELARQGWRVTVFNSCGDEEGTYDGVTYMPFERLNPEDAFNIIVGWRNVRLFDVEYRCRQAYLWLHDVPNPAAFTRSRLDRIDRVVVLSESHRQGLPHVPDHQVLPSANGIDVAEFEVLDGLGCFRNPHRCVYASSYDRGLEPLLLIWPAVRLVVPEAELHVCYGWESFAGREEEPAFAAWKIRMEALLRQDGVVHHGRIGQAELAQLMATSGILAYPCQWPETSCITAMKAQAAGAVPVVIAYAALEETVQYGIKLPALPDGAISDELRERYADRLIDALSDTAWQEFVREEMISWARRTFSWKHVADQWHQQFTIGREGLAA